MTRFYAVDDSIRTNAHPKDVFVPSQLTVTPRVGLIFELLDCAQYRNLVAAA